MATSDDRFRAVLEAAQCLLAARDDGMVTAAEWEALQEAVDACERPRPTDADRTT